MQNMAADQSVRMRMGFDSLNDRVPHGIKSANTRGAVSREEIVKTEAAPIVPVGRFFGLLLNHMNKALDNRERLRPFPQIMENVGVDHSVKVIRLAIIPFAQIVKLPQLQHLAHSY